MVSNPRSLTADQPQAFQPLTENAAGNADLVPRPRSSLLPHWPSFCQRLLVDASNMPDCWSLDCEQILCSLVVCCDDARSLLGSLLAEKAIRAGAVSELPGLPQRLQLPAAMPRIQNCSS